MSAWQENYQLYKRYVKNIALIYNKRKDVRNYIELMLSLSVIVIFGMFAIRPTFITIVELRQSINAKERTLELLNNKIDDLDRAQQVKVQFQNQLALLNTAVPDGPLPVVFARQIEGLAKRHNAQLFSIETQGVSIIGSQRQVPQEEIDPEETDRYPTESDSVEFTFDIIGTYQNIMELIADLERLRRPIFIDSMQMRTSDDSVESGFVVLSVTGRVPFILE